MNKRFEELAKQADIYIDEIKCAVTGNRTELIDWHIEQFGKLIVRECLNGVGHYTNVDEGIAAVKKNFGVEE